MIIAKGKTSERRLRRRAFTLIELLVVIAIISLLVSILLPSLKRAKQLAQRAVCASNLRGIGTVLQMYASDNQGAFPAGAGDPNGVLGDAGIHAGWAGATAFGWLLPIGYYGQAAMEQYGGEAKMFYCPSNSEKQWMDQLQSNWLSKDAPAGDIGYFAWCGREVAVYPGWSIFAFLPKSPMKSDTASVDWLMMGDLSSDNLGPAYNSHGEDEGGNWLKVGGNVDWVQRDKLTEVYAGQWQPQLQFKYPDVN